MFFCVCGVCSGLNVRCGGWVLEGGGDVHGFGAVVVVVIVNRGTRGGEHADW